MKRFAAVPLLWSAWSRAQTVRGVTNKNAQTSSGNCSPNIVSSAAGPVTVKLVGSCNGVDPRLVRELTQSVQRFVAQFPKTIGNLNELLDKKNIEIAEKVREVEEWTRKYRELTQRLEEGQSADNELSKQTFYALRDGNLSRAEALLKNVMSKDEQYIDCTARKSLQSRFDL